MPPTEPPDLNQIVQNALMRGVGQYTVGPGNLDHVIDMVTEDTMRVLQPMVRQRVVETYGELVRG